MALRMRCSLCRKGEPQSNTTRGAFPLSFSASSVGLIKRGAAERTGAEATKKGEVGVNSNVSGRRRLAWGEERSRSEVNFIGDRDWSPWRLGDVCGWLAHERNRGRERAAVVFTRNKVLGLVGVVGARITISDERQLENNTRLLRSLVSLIETAGKRQLLSVASPFVESVSLKLASRLRLLLIGKFNEQRWDSA